MIVSCEHNQGAMGMCRQCTSEIEESEKRMSAARQKREELVEAARIAAKYGLHQAAADLRRESER